MKNKLTILTLVLMAFFTSCNPDDEDTNSGNGGNGGNGGGSNTGSAASYPEIVNLLEGNWYGVSLQYINTNGTTTDILTSGTESIGYITFNSNPIGSLDVSTWLHHSQSPDDTTTWLGPESSICTKYPVSVSAFDESWGGSGTIGNYFFVANWSDVQDSYAILKYNDPFYNLSTSTISYGIEFDGGTWIVLSNYANLPGIQKRIHTLNEKTLIIVFVISDNTYGKMTLVRV
jgi:hypothetical protein